MDRAEFRESVDRLRATYRMQGARPRKGLGQNFLLDWNLLGAIVDDAALTGNEVVLEVGTGPGYLTRLLGERSAAVISCDKDPELLEFARGTVSGLPNVELLEKDVLRDKRHLSPEVISAVRAGLAGHREGRGRMVANLPYSVATPVILAVLRELPEIERLVVMTQKELGDRLAARPKTRSYGPPAVLVSLVAGVEVLRRVPPAVFWPRPRVESVILSIRRRGESGLPSRPGAFDRFLARAFSQRRKTLRASLGPALEPAGGPEKKNPDRLLGPWGRRRPEELTPEELVELFEAVNPFLT